jgi:tyrosine-protein kinase Etk/Wzc
MNNEQLADDKSVTNNQVFSNIEDEINLSELISTLIEAKWLIGIITVAFLLAGVFYALIATPIYQADALLQVEEKKGGMMAGLGDLTGMFSEGSSTSTEINIIKSRSILGKVVDDLKLDLNVTPKYFPIIGRAIVRRHGNKGVAKPRLGMDNYAWGGERVKIERLELDGSTKNFRLVAKGNNVYHLYNPKQSNQDIPALIGTVGELARGEGVAVFISELVARPGSEFSVSKSNRLGVIKSLQNRLKITEPKGRSSYRGTGILEIVLTGTDKEKITKIINSVANLYLRQNVDRMSEEAERSLDFLQKQVPIIKDKMSLAEIKLNNYRTSKTSVDLTLETQSILQQLVEVERRISEVEIKRAEILEKFTDKHPIAVALANQEFELKIRLDKIAKRAQKLPEIQQEVLRLSRDVEVASTIYMQLLNKTQELKVAKAGTIGNVRIIDKAMASNNAIKPKKTMIVLLSTILGLFLGIAIAFVRRAMNKGVEDPDSIEKNTGIPVYANIPLSTKQLLLDKDVLDGKAKHAILCEIDLKDQAIEGLRSLRTNLHFALLEAKNNIVMITGPAPGVGKSFVSTNFAHVVAKSNKKVLLIDADMRKGHINKEYEIAREPGLSELIIGEIDKETAVHQTEFENVFVLTTGSIPPNPSELLMHENFEKYLNEFNKEYDLILVDTPPLLAVTDAAVIGRFCGTTFILLRYGMHSMAEIHAVTKRLRQNNIEPRGFVFNALQSHKGYGKYSYGKYGYGKYGHYTYVYK